MKSDDFTSESSSDEIVTNSEKYSSDFLAMMRSWASDTEEFQPNIDVPTEVRRYELPADRPQDFNIVTYDPKGKASIDKNAILDYLSSRYIVFNGETPYQFNGCVYQKVDTDYLSRLIYNAVDSYSNAPFLSKNTVSDIIAKFKVTRTAGDIHFDYDWESEYGWKYETEDGNGLIPFQNGLYNIETDELLPFTPSRFIAYQLHTMYRPAITEHSVEDIYKGIIPDDRTRFFFYQMVGFTLFSIKMQTPAIFLIYGGGNTGKSALQEAVATALGREYVSTLGINQISGDFMTSMLEGKLMNVCGETGDRPKDITRVDGELLKKLTDGQPITVQRKYGQPYQMCNTAKLWFVSNSTPDFGDNSSGLYRRLYIIPCRQTQSWDAQIYGKMQEDEAISWLINKSLHAYRRFKANNCKFAISDEMRVEMSYFTQQDNLMDFIEHHFGTTDKNEVANDLVGRSSADLYKDYVCYLQAVGGKPLSRKKFAEKIRNEYNMKLSQQGCEILGKKTTRSVYARR